nr:hypothetical protein [bacterium]
MIITDTEQGIHLRWRDVEGVRCENTISHDDFSPYFFVRAVDVFSPDQDNKLNEDIYLKEKWGGANSHYKLVVSYTNGDWVNLDNEELVKVTWKPSHPRYMKKLKEYFHAYPINTYEADVRHHYRYAVDEIEYIPEYDLRKWYWDMEWQQGGEHDGSITCVVMYDNFEKTFYRYSWFPNLSKVKETYTPSINENVKDYMFHDEQTMLENFILAIQDKDPDMLISWFGWKFDLPKLIERLHANNIDPRLLSPVKEVDGVSWSIKNGGIHLHSNRIESYSPVTQPIKGRICVPLDMAFERQWNDAQRGTLPSMALDYVAETVLGQKKLVSEKFPDKSEFFRRGWLEDTTTYLEYAQIDVDLLVKIDNTNHTTEAILSLQRLLLAPFDACFYASNMGGIYFMRNASWKAPTGRKGDRINYDGAMVYDPLSEGTNGLHLGVAAFDFAGLYPSMMIARNISWETKSNVVTEFGVNIKTPKDFSELTSEDMRYYKTDKLGLLPKAVLELKDLRNEYKKKMKEAETKGDYIKWNNNQLAVKRLMASFYGIVAFQGFGWADVDLAASITASAREAIRAAAFKVREL